MPQDLKSYGEAPAKASVKLGENEIPLDETILEAAAAHVEQTIANIGSAWADPFYASNTSTLVRNCKFLFWLSAIEHGLEEAGRPNVTVMLKHGPGEIFTLPLIARVLCPFEGPGSVTLCFLHMDLWPVATAVRTILRRWGR